MRTNKTYTIKIPPTSLKVSEMHMFQHLVFYTLVKVKVYLEVDQHI